MRRLALVLTATIVAAAACSAAKPASPRTQTITATPAPAASPSAVIRFRQHGVMVAVPPRDFQPTAIAFWDRKHGVLAGTAGCPHKCTGLISVTTDGGAHWQVVLGTVTGRPLDIAVAGKRDAWAVLAQCSPDGTCTYQWWCSADGGHTWRQVETNALITSAFADAQTGWALGPGASGLGGGLEETTDGGKTWHRRPSPCAPPRFAAHAVSAPDRTTVYVLCVGQPGIGMQAKALKISHDGGATWQTAAVAPKDGLSGLGYAEGIEFLPKGVGFLWEARGGLLATRDGGRHWQAAKGVVPDTLEATDVSFVAPQVGFALLHDMRHPEMRLARTTDGGATWKTVATWAPGM